MISFINSVWRTINFYYILIDFFRRIRFDIQVFRTKIIPIIFYFLSLSLSLVQSLEQIGDSKLFALGVPLDGTWNMEQSRSSSFLNGIASKNATNSRIVITRPRYPRIIDIGGKYISIPSHYSTKSSRYASSGWEKCMLIHNARLYHDVLLSRNGKWNAWTIAPHSTHIYIYIYTRESRLL